MATRCIVRIVDAQQGKHVDLYHHYDGYVDQNAGVAFDICNTFYNKDKDMLVFPLHFDQLVNKFLKGEVGDGDMGYEYLSHNMLGIEYIYTISYNEKNVELTVQEVERNLDTDELETTMIYTQQELVNLYKRGAGLLSTATDEQLKQITALFEDLSWNKDRYTKLLEGLYNVGNYKDLTLKQGDELISLLQNASLTLK